LPVGSFPLTAHELLLPVEQVLVVVSRLLQQA